MAGKRRALALALSLSLGCSSFGVPYAEYTSAEIPASESPPLVAAVLPPVWDLSKPGDEVAPEQAREFTDRLVRDLRSTELFASVEEATLATAPAGSIRIRPTYVPRYCFSEPLFTVLTLGAVPTLTCANAGYALRIDGLAVDHPVVVDTSERVSAVWGWIAFPLNLLASRTREIANEREVAVLRQRLERVLEGADP